MSPENLTSVLQFTILGYPDMTEKRILLFLLFVCVYVTTILGNLVIIIITNSYDSLQTPMYFLLGKLSIIDICYISVTVPQMLFFLASKQNTISFAGCIVQLYSMIFLESAECVLLAIMAYDRYLAICRPLHYILIMNRAVCYKLLSGAIFSSALHSLLHTLLIAQLPFCHYSINHFFCDIPPLLKLSCTDTHVNEILLFAVSGVFVGLGPLLMIFVSYAFIVCKILKMKAGVGRWKTFSTCTSHLTIVTIFYGTGSFTYVRPKSSYSLDRDKLVSVFYNIATPLLNPIIYSLRNSEVKKSITNGFRRYCVFQQM
ncbi:olfactory receptor 5V1-like [Bombina bombina]|uniref:olfactory receptor 5V1-like n=1 Tax=Bombina bombina TaxID=8345 RepID=UPI00235B2E47|nr:olfactory receptor 5V1-like [Bombina bombina]